MVAALSDININIYVTIIAAVIFYSTCFIQLDLFDACMATLASRLVQHVLCLWLCFPVQSPTWASCSLEQHPFLSQPPHTYLIWGMQCRAAGAALGWRTEVGEPWLPLAADPLW